MAIDSHQHPLGLMDVIRLLEAALGAKARLNFLSMQDGDVLATHADLNRLCEISHFVPRMFIEDVVDRFVTWYVDF